MPAHTPVERSYYGSALELDIHLCQRALHFGLMRLLGHAEGDLQHFLRRGRGMAGRGY